MWTVNWKDFVLFSLFLMFSSQMWQIQMYKYFFSLVNACDTLANVKSTQRPKYTITNDEKYLFWNIWLLYYSHIHCFAHHFHYYCIWVRRRMAKLLNMKDMAFSFSQFWKFIHKWNVLIALHSENIAIKVNGHTYTLWVSEAFLLFAWLEGEKKVEKQNT